MSSVWHNWEFNSQPISTAAVEEQNRDSFYEKGERDFINTLYI